MNAKRTIDRAILVAAVIGSLILLNFVGLGLFKRLDLTHDKQFTLSSATRSLLRDLSDPVTVRAYFTRDLPHPYANNRRYIHDLLEEYFTAGRGNFRYEFIDPVEEESDEDREQKKEKRRDIFGRLLRQPTSVEHELGAMGIMPVQVHVNEGDKLEIKRAYMGIAISSGDKREVIPVVQNTAGLEYTLTTLLRKLTSVTRPKIGFLTGHEGPSLETELVRFKRVVEPLYDITELDTTTSAEIPIDVDVMLVVGPRTPLSEDEQRALDEFVARGGSVAFFLDSVTPKLPNLSTEPAKHGLTDMLKTYGVTLEPGLVLDARCATITIQRKQGFFIINEPVRYPYLPVPENLNPDHPVSRGLSAVAFAFMSPLTVTPDGNDRVSVTVLARSSETSWVEKPPHDLEPSRQWTATGELRPQDLLVALSGPLRRHFEPATLEQESSSQEPEDGGSDARILVAGGAAFLSDQLLSAANEAFVLNLMDWLVRDDALLAVRTRGLATASLKEVSERMRVSIKYLAVFGLPGVFVLFGIVRWRLRESRRSRVTL